MPSPWLTIDRRRDMYLNIKTYHIYIAVYIIRYNIACEVSLPATRTPRSGSLVLVVWWSSGRVARPMLWTILDNRTCDTQLPSHYSQDMNGKLKIKWLNNVWHMNPSNFLKSAALSWMKWKEALSDPDGGGGECSAVTSESRDMQSVVSSSVNIVH